VETWSAGMTGGSATAPSTSGALRVYVYDAAWMQLDAPPPLDDDDVAPADDGAGVFSPHSSAGFGAESDDVAVPVPPIVAAHVNATVVARERQLAINIANVATLRKRLEQRLERGVRTLRALEAQRDAILATVDNLVTHHLGLVKAGVEHISSQQARFDAKYRSTLDVFDDDCRRLREIAVHPLLLGATGGAQSSSSITVSSSPRGARSLLELVPMSQYTAARQTALDARERLAKSIGALRQRVDACAVEADRVVEATRASLPSLSQLRTATDVLRASVADAVQFEATLKQEYDALCDVLAGRPATATTTTTTTTTTTAGGARASIARSNSSVRDAHMQRLEQAVTDTALLRRQLREARVATRAALFDAMHRERPVALRVGEAKQLQHELAGVAISAHREAALAADVARWPGAYVGALAEIARRRHVATQLASEQRRLIAALNAPLSVEAHRRSAWLRQHGRLARLVLPALERVLGHVHAQALLDTDLPPIELADVVAAAALAHVPFDARALFDEPIASSALGDSLLASTTTAAANTTTAMSSSSSGSNSSSSSVTTTTTKATGSGASMTSSVTSAPHTTPSTSTTAESVANDDAVPAVDVQIYRQRIQDLEA
jgi:hypothetical protein